MIPLSPPNIDAAVGASTLIPNRTANPTADVSERIRIRRNASVRVGPVGDGVCSCWHLDSLSLSPTKSDVKWISGQVRRDAKRVQGPVMTGRTWSAPVFSTKCD
jgi:hypothetical protein